MEIAEPERLVGKTTVQAMQSGLFYGYVGQVDGILERLLAEYPGSKVVATGGLAKVIAPSSRFIQRGGPGPDPGRPAHPLAEEPQARAMPLPLIRLAEVDSTQAFLERHPELGFCGVLADAQTRAAAPAATPGRAPRAPGSGCPRPCRRPPVPPGPGAAAGHGRRGRGPGALRRAPWASSGPTTWWPGKAAGW